MNDFIFHYTSLDTLAIILKNKNIRFNSLKNVDDVNETEFSDENNINLSSHTLISCWTKNEEENLAFWNMYTPNMQGVRIKLPRDIFEVYNFKTTNDFYVRENQNIMNSLVPESECFNDKYWILPFKNHFLEVEYTDDESFLKPKLFNLDGEQYKFETGIIGKYKSRIWEFQKEVRFKLIVLPTQDLNNNRINPFNDFVRIMYENIPAPIENYYLPIKQNAFEKMEITLGPKCNLSQEIIVESLIEKYNPNAKMIKNKYQGLIR
ncbi:Protein of unknown function [Epilithonimonas bovis DSM 19482]|uniref:DUF2971 domain-containing protein n=1 Tax=Epilithonimonas bovis DSM 19482 TaxID=1121284 RepID=A0A1U7Q1H5_9FLAO|nr:DUF2971 domain-containing protein [Epilithonimonas bovis]SIT98760.1 Protein of unknown function [Epilithonimonas bovis DSM 19482]